MTEKEKKLYEDRLKKLEDLVARGTDPYPSSTGRTHEIKAVLQDFTKLSEKQSVVTLAGRIRALRKHGGIIFANLEDSTGAIQLMIRENELGEGEVKFFSEHFDIGDFLEGTGVLVTTKTGQQTLQVQSFAMLAKSLRALPEQWHGLADVEQKLRKRYLDILFNPEVKEIFVKKALFWRAMREHLEQSGFLEVQMPVLESTPGGAEARPFITHHNALDRDFYLRISLELPLKKMLVAGYEKVYEIGRIFRNEGISTEHLQDYTQMEFYWAYASFEQMMAFCQKMYQHIIQATFGTLRIARGGMTVDWSGEWERVNYFEVFKDHTGIDLETASDGDLKKYADKHKISYEDFAERGRLIDLIFKEVRKKLGNDKPIFLINQPVELEPLAKRVPGNERAVQRMQIIAYGTELGKGFGELNDPVDQRRRFEEQMKLREKGDDEAQMMDEDYLEAMEYGMPLAAGFGLSERLFSVLMDKSIRETTIFPLMKDSSPSVIPAPFGRELMVEGKAGIQDKELDPRVKPEDDKRYSKVPDRDEALKLLHQHVKTPNLIKHMLATESFMRVLARKFGEDEQKWGVAGLLHDIDYDEIKDPSQHSLVGSEILRQAGMDEEIVQAVKTHNDHHGIAPVTMLDKALQVSETYTGFIVACALVQPDKKLSSVNVESAMKKFKSKSFASGANRESMAKCEALLGMKVEEMMEMCIQAMQGIAGELGL